MPMSVVDSVWSERDTTPAAVEAALRGLVAEHTRAHADTMPARALNLVSVVDAQWSGEIANRLGRVGRLAPSRNVVCQVEPGRETLDARATVSGRESGSDGVATLRETVVVSVGERHLEHLDTIVDPLVVTDVATVVWSPHGHAEAVDALLPLSQAVLLDSRDEPDPTDALARVGRLARGRARRRPLVAARDAVARALGRDVRPGRPAGRAGHAGRRHRAPPCRLRRGGAAAGRLAGRPAGLARVRADPSREWPGRPRALAPRRGDGAPGARART